MPENDPEDPEIRKMEREYEHREKNLDAASDILKEAPGLLGELTNEVVIPLLKNLQPQQHQQMWSPPEDRQQPRERQHRGKPQYNPHNQDEAEKKGEDVRQKLDMETEVTGAKPAADE